MYMYLYIVRIIALFQYLQTGHAETIVTSKALENMTKKRSFIIGRSTFPGTGAYGGHWTG